MLENILKRYYNSPTRLYEEQPLLFHAYILHTIDNPCPEERGKMDYYNEWLDKYCNVIATKEIKDDKSGKSN